MSLPDAARAVSLGFHIFPIEPGGKLPHLIRPDAEYRLRWGEVATADLGRVIDWWTYSPTANIGVACKPSGLLVLDSDMAKEPGILLKGVTPSPWAYLHDDLGEWLDGDDILRAMCDRWGQSFDELQATYRVCTGSGGAHRYFRWPAGVQASQSSPVPGLLDSRCNGGQKGGYVLGAGSVTEKGRYAVENDAPILEAPPWIVELCREKPRPVKPKPLFSQPTGGGGSTGLVNTVRYAQAGNVNASLHWAACVMREDGVTEEQCAELLVEAYVEANGRGGERQALQTINSAFRSQGG